MATIKKTAKKIKTMFIEIGKKNPDIWKDVLFVSILSGIGSAVSYNIGYKQGRTDGIIGTLDYVAGAFAGLLMQNGGLK